MDNIIELLSNLIQMFLWTWFISDFFGFKNKGNTCKIKFVAMWIAAFVIITYINSAVIYDGFLTGIISMLYMLYAWLWLNGKFAFKFFVVIFSTAIIFSIGSIVIFVFSFLTGFSTKSLIGDFSTMRMIMIVICRALEYLIFKSISSINKEYAFSKKEWLLFISMPLLTWVAITLITQSSTEFETLRPEMFYIGGIMVFMNFVIYFFMIKIKEDEKHHIENELMQGDKDNTKKMMTNMSALSENVYCVKHDLDKHFCTIKDMAQNGDLTGIEAYASDIINNHLNAVQKVVITDNSVFNSIVNAKLEICKKKNIHVKIKISKDDIKYIKPYDATVIFGNLFDNAIEACEKTDNKIIILNICSQRDYISICMENSFDNKFSNVSLRTSKSDYVHHGIGTKSIKKVINENDGIINFFENDFGMFCCDILYKKR